jgi:hypothetical protein
MPPRAAYSEQVAAMVRRELAKDPAVGNDVLREKARGLGRGVRRLSPRQFHATYRLPALRSVASVTKSAPAANNTAKSGARNPTTGAAKSAGTTPIETPAVANPVPAPPAGPSAPAAPTVKSRSNGSPAPVEMAPPPASAIPTPTPSSKALARPHAAEREAVRGILQLVAREALATEDRASFVRLLDGLDERAAVILGRFGRA